MCVISYIGNRDGAQGVVARFDLRFGFLGRFLFPTAEMQHGNSKTPADTRNIKHFAPYRARWLVVVTGGLGFELVRAIVC